MFLYNLFLFCYPKIAKLLGLFNTKAKQWCIGQAEVWNEIEQKSLKINGPVIWIHAASYGEFEQGLPIIEALKIKYPNYQIWLSFFSPSGYMYRKDDPSVDVVTYLPFDGPSNANRFIEIVNPKLIVFIKYEFWHFYLSEAKSKKIPTILASAIFRPNQIFFKWYGGFYRNMLSLFTRILVQDEDAFQLLKPIVESSKLFITGDTRFDRVIKTASSINTISWMELLPNAQNIIAGSTWQEDDVILSKAASHFSQFNWIIAPHHVDPKSIDACLRSFPNAMTLTQLLNNGQKQLKPIVLIIDRIGILRNLYQYAYVSYVGGGFGQDGVHNVLEPAAFGKPVIWGHNDHKYKEAIGLRMNKGGFSIKNESDFVFHLNELILSSSHYQQASTNAKDYIFNNAGATAKTMAKIAPYLD